MNAQRRSAAEYSALDEPSTAFDWLGRAVDERDSMMNMIRFDPAARGIRQDQRFHDFFQRTSLPRAVDH